MSNFTKQQKKDLKKLSRKQLIKQVILARDAAAHYSADADLAHTIIRSIQDDKNTLTRELEHKTRLLNAVANS